MSMPMRFVLWNQEDCEPYLVAIRDEDEWQRALQKLDAMGVSYSQTPIESVSPEALVAEIEVDCQSDEPEEM